MEKFTIVFPLGAEEVQAEVAMIRQEDHIQFTVTPLHTDMERKYGTQVFHLFPGKELQPAFPGVDEESRRYAGGVIKALDKYAGEKAPRGRSHAGK